eukprot:scaffold228_cov312-Pinguiococcus_pyrenoidosus.AAC.37
MLMRASSADPRLGDALTLPRMRLRPLELRLESIAHARARIPEGRATVGAVFYAAVSALPPRSLRRLSRSSRRRNAPL